MKLGDFTRTRLEQALMDVLGIQPEGGMGNQVSNAIYYWESGRPYESSRDLVRLYATNLRTGGVRAGPDPQRFGDMVVEALDSTGSFLNGNLVAFDRGKFAAKAADIVVRNPLVRSVGRRDFAADLKQIAHGDGPKGLMSDLVCSVEAFSQYLITVYEGSAIKFSDRFSDCIKGSGLHERVANAADFQRAMISELDFRLMGPAITRNFLKDSQIGRARTFESIVNLYLGALAKPDMHVMRMMLAITGRVPISNMEALQQLSTMSQPQYKKLYRMSQPEPNSGWPVPGGGLTAEELCLNDLLFACLTSDFPALEADRIIYMAGSGKVPPNTIPKPPSDQLERYRGFLASLGVFPGAAAP